MQLKEVKCSVHRVVLCPSLCHDLHAKLMSSGSYTDTAELNNAHSVPPASCNYNYRDFSVALRLLQPSYAHFCVHSTCVSIALQVEVIWRGAWGPQMAKCSPKLYLPLYKLSTAGNSKCFYMCVKLKYKKWLLSDEFTSAWHAWQSLSEVKNSFPVTGANSSRQAACLPQEVPTPTSYYIFPN